MATRIQGVRTNFDGQYMHQGGPFIIDVTNDEAFIIRKDGDGGDIFVVDTSASPATVTITGDIIVSGSGSGIQYGDDVALTLGASDPSSFLWETKDPNANALILSLPLGGGVDVPVFAIGGAGGTAFIDADLGLFNGITFPTLAVVDLDNDSWIGLDHSADDAPRLRSNKAFLVGDAAANLLVTVDGGSSGVRLNDFASIGTAVISSAFLAIPNSTTAVASINLGSTGAAPSSPNEGDIWYDGTNFVGRDGTTNRALDVQSTSGGGWTDDGAIVRLTGATDNVIIGDTANVAIGGATPKFVVMDTDTTSAISVSLYAADAVGPQVAMSKSRGALGTVGTVVVANDVMGKISWFGDDGTDLAQEVARIEVQAKATVGANRVPGEMVISTAVDSAGSALAAAITIDKAQDVTFGGGITTTTASVFVGDLSLDGDLDFVGAQEIATGGNNTLTLNPGTANVSVVDGARLIVGHSASVLTVNSPILQVQDTGGDSGIAVTRYSADGSGCKFFLAKSRGALGTPGTTIVSGDTIGSINWVGDDGTDITQIAASIEVVSSGTIAGNRVPGEMVFRTAVDAAGSALAIVLTLDNAKKATFTGAVDIGVSPLSFGGAHTIDTSGNNLLTLDGGTTGVLIGEILQLEANIGITAGTGSVQGNEAQTKGIIQISICANGGDAVTLPSAVAGMVVFVMNDGAQSADIFPASGDNIDEAGANIAKALAVDKNSFFIATDATHWSTCLTA